MRYPVHAIRDIKTTFFPPQVSQTEDAAIRSFAMACNNAQSDMGFSPADFDLFCVAEFDSLSGELFPVSPIRFIVNGASLVQHDSAPKRRSKSAKS